MKHSLAFLLATALLIPLDAMAWENRTAAELGIFSVASLQEKSESSLKSSQREYGLLTSATTTQTFLEADQELSLRQSLDGIMPIDKGHPSYSATSTNQFSWDGRRLGQNIALGLFSRQLGDLSRTFDKDELGKGKFQGGESVRYEAAYAMTRLTSIRAIVDATNSIGYSAYEQQGAAVNIQHIFSPTTTGYWNSNAFQGKNAIGGKYQGESLGGKVSLQLSHLVYLGGGIGRAEQQSATKNLSTNTAELTLEYRGQDCQASLGNYIEIAERPVTREAAAALRSTGRILWKSALGSQAAIDLNYIREKKSFPGSELQTRQVARVSLAQILLGDERMPQYSLWKASIAEDFSRTANSIRQEQIMTSTLGLSWLF